MLQSATVPTTTVTDATATPRDPFALLQAANEKAGVVLSDCVVPGEGEPKQIPRLEEYLKRDPLLAEAVMVFRQTAGGLDWEERRPMQHAIRGALQRLGATAQQTLSLWQQLDREAQQGYQSPLPARKPPSVIAGRRPRREDPPAR